MRDRAEDPELEYSVLSANFPNTLSVPLLREGVPLGAITVTRAEVALFSDRQIALLQTFADQAVIAIENVRLFKELETRNGDLTEALEQQTATGEILRAISSSPTDVQPVFDTIVESAGRLCSAESAAVYRFEGEMAYFVAGYHFSSETIEAYGRQFPRPLRETDHLQRVVEGSVLNIADIENDPHTSTRVADTYRSRGVHSTVLVPMFRQGRAIGAIGVSHHDLAAFSDERVELLKTFADQAVIAIENVRLFRELEARNKDLGEALERQTATADILRAISQAQTDVQPVYEVIADSAMRLFRAWGAAVVRYDGEMVSMVAARGGSPGSADAARERLRPPHRPTNPPELTLNGNSRWRARRESAGPDAGYRPCRPGAPPIPQWGPYAPCRQERHPAPPADPRHNERLRNFRSGLTVLTKRVHHVVDVETDPSCSSEFRRHAAERGFRSFVAVPMLRGDDVVGVIAVTRAEPGSFTPAESALLQTFADQAVIAIENVRLFTELRERTAQLSRSVAELTALGQVSQALSSTLDIETVLTTIVLRAIELSGADGGSVYEYDDTASEFRLRATQNFEEELVEAARTMPLGEGALGMVADRRQPIQIADISDPAVYRSPLRDVLLRTGYRAILALPLLREDRLVGALVVGRKAAGDFLPGVIDLLTTFANQSALAIQNARLFREIADKSAQLEAASRHKSEFLANMSHELRTPLNAVIGFSEVLLDRMFGEVNEKQTEYLQDILSSGRHLLSLINDILDLSKIEAGRMDLALTPFHVPAAIDNAVTLVRERAARHGIVLHVDVDARLGEWVGDERKIKQVLLNLLSNAVKFTPEGGRIGVKAVLADRAVEISVSDTGIGIAPENQGAIFEEFRQVGGDEARQEGTGLGLTLTKKFVEMHGGRIWVESAVGRGSAFTFTLPIRS